MYSNLIKHIRRFVELNEDESIVIDQYFCLSYLTVCQYQI